MRPAWSPDGRRIAFSSKRGAVFDIYSKTVDSGEPEQSLFDLPGDKLVEHWSPDGRYLVGTLLRSGLWILPAGAREKPWRVRASEAAETWQSEFSPDGRWLSLTCRRNPATRRSTSSRFQPQVRAGRCPRAAEPSRTGGVTARSCSSWVRTER